MFLSLPHPLRSPHRQFHANHGSLPPTRKYFPLHHPSQRHLLPSQHPSSHPLNLQLIPPQELLSLPMDVNSSPSNSKSDNRSSRSPSTNWIIPVRLPRVLQGNIILNHVFREGGLQ